MRVLFLGTPEAAVPALRAVARGHEVVAVACRPDRPAGRGRRMVEPPVKLAAIELGLPVLQPETLRGTELREQVGSLRADAMVVVAYGRILGPRFLALAPRGALNLHFSLLPRWRGAAPVQRAMLAGETRTGVTTMKLVAELDAGPIYEQAVIDIGEDEHAGDLELRLAVKGADLLASTLDAMSAGAVPRAQEDARATWAPPLRKEEGALDARRPAAELARAVRALDPWPGTWVELERGPLAILSARAADDWPAGEPGTVLVRGADVALACGTGALLLRSVRPAGRAAMPARSALSGRFVREGERARLPPPLDLGEETTS